MKMWFDFARKEGFPSQFADQFSSVNVDVLEIGLIYSFLILALSFYVVLPSKRNIKFVSFGVRVSLSIFIGLVIVLGIFGQEWETGHIKTKTLYKPGSKEEIEADIGLKIGFHSINVTLKSENRDKKNLQQETINYNERFEWSWDQGRFGFGPYAGKLQQEFRAAQYRGTPLPILWIVDYFVFDGEGLRFGRFYRTSGWYSSYLLWLSLPCWILANIFYTSVIRIGNNCLLATGLLQLASCIVWASVRNPMNLVIPFEDGTLKLKYGPSFYLTLFGGLLCVFLSVLLHILNTFLPDDLAIFFNISPLSDYDEIHLTPEEAALVRNKNRNMNDMGMKEMGSSQEEPIETNASHNDVVIFKRRNTINLYGRKVYRNMPSEFDSYDNDFGEEVPIYDNVQEIHNERNVFPVHQEEEPVEYVNTLPTAGPALPPKSGRSRRK